MPILHTKTDAEAGAATDGGKVVSRDAILFAGGLNQFEPIGPNSLDLKVCDRTYLCAGHRERGHDAAPNWSIELVPERG